MARGTITVQTEANHIGARCTWKQIYQCGHILVAVALLFVPWRLSAQTALDREFECVMEAQQLVKLASPVVGVLAELAVDRGDLVHKDQFLGKLEDSVEETSAAFAKMKATNDFPIKSIEARLQFLRRKRERAEQLVAREAASQAASDEATSDAGVAEQQLKEAELNLRLSQVEAQRAEAQLRQRTLRSPIDGLVVERLLVPGEYRNEQSPILTLAEMDPLRVEAFVPIRYYGQIAVGSDAEVRPEEPIGGVHVAKVTVVDRVMDAASATFGVRLKLPNPDFHLPAGVRCKVRFARGVPADSLPIEQEWAGAPKDKADGLAVAATDQAKKVESEKAITADELHGAGDRAATEKLAVSEGMASEKMIREKLVMEDKATSVAAAVEKQAANPPPRQAANDPAGELKLAAVSSVAHQQTTFTLWRAIQLELRRAGCFAHAAGDDWNTASQRALDLFNQHARIKLDSSSASTDALDAVKGTQGRVCPLVCDRGYRADGDRCAKITCRTGYAPSKDATCERTPAERSARRDDTSKAIGRVRAKVQAKRLTYSKPQHSGGMPSDQRASNREHQ